MATFIETLGLLNYFSGLFAAVLVFAIVFALLHQTRILGENKAIQALIAVILALLVLIYPDLVNLINFIAPWFVLLFVFIIMLLMVWRIFGVSESSISEFVLNEKAVNWAFVAVGLLILLAGIFNVFGQRALEQQGSGSDGGAETGEDGQFDSNLFTTLFNPKIMGVGLVFAIAIFSIAFLGGSGPASSGVGGGGGGHH